MSKDGRPRQSASAPRSSATGPTHCRYFLLREVAYENDGNFTWDRFDARYAARSRRYVRQSRIGFTCRWSIATAVASSRQGSPESGARARGADDDRRLQPGDGWRTSCNQSAALVIELATRARPLRRRDGAVEACESKRDAELDQVLVDLVRTVARLAIMSRRSSPPKRTSCGIPWGRIGALRACASGISPASRWALDRRQAPPTFPQARCGLASLPGTSVTERTPSDLTGSSTRSYVSSHMKKKHAERKWTVMLVPHARVVPRRGGVTDGRQGARRPSAASSRCVSRTRRHGAVARVNVTRAARSSARISAGERGAATARAPRRTGVTLSTSSASASRRCACSPGLSPIAKDVQAGRIGGPSGQWSERDSLAGSGCQRPAGTRRAHRHGPADAPREHSSCTRSTKPTIPPRASARGTRRCRRSCPPRDGSPARSRASACIRFCTWARPHEGIDVSARWGWRSMRRRRASLRRCRGSKATATC